MAKEYPEKALEMVKICIFNEYNSYYGIKCDINENNCKNIWNTQNRSLHLQQN